jgi:hypothetical protein
MNSYEERVGQSLRRVEGWFAANPELVAGNAALGTQVEALKGIVVRLTDHATAQDTQFAQSLLISKDEIDQRRVVLQHQMAPIAQVGRALRGTVPGIGVLTIPKANAPTAEIITAAEVLSQKAEIYKEVLVEHGLPADFIDQLKQAAAALKASVDGRGLARASMVAATRGVKSEVALGRRVVAIIDAVVTGLIRSNPVKLAEWRQLKRVTLKAGAPRQQVGLVDPNSNAVQTNSNAVQTNSIPLQTNSIPVQTSPTGIAAAPMSGEKAA